MADHRRSTAGAGVLHATVQARLTDVLIVGAGAAGLATAIFLRRLTPGSRVTLVDGARRPGAKILVSGGARCNVTNAQVSERDFHSGSRPLVRHVLRTLSVADTIAFFDQIGVRLHEEEHGKLFPDSNRARDVLEALLREADRLGVERIDGCRVTAVAYDRSLFVAETSRGRLTSHRLVLATGGQSLPKSGSDGAGFTFAGHFGHTIVPPVPALVPLVLGNGALFPHAALAGVSHDAEIAVWRDGRVVTRVRGSLLWTHFGISGPVALDVSRHWSRAAADGHQVRLTLSFIPGATFEATDTRLVALIAERSRTSMQALLHQFVPAAVASALIGAEDLDPTKAAGSLARESRRRLAHALSEFPLPVIGTRGYNYAEVTAGGVSLGDVHARTLESRLRPGLYFAGEMLDVDGRLGGFNFQWAWSSGMTVARALAQASTAGER